MFYKEMIITIMCGKVFGAFIGLVGVYIYVNHTQYALINKLLNELEEKNKKQINKNF